MIYAFSFTCNRDLKFSKLMVRTFKKHCPAGSISITNTDEVQEYKEYGNGAGWPAAMMKLKGLTDIIKTKNVKDDDFILSVDSDVVFCSTEVFKFATPDYGVIGIKHKPEFNTALGKWSHMSGALIFIRGDIAKKMCALPIEVLNLIRHQGFKKFDITENEDVVLSYLASYVGAIQFDLPGHLSSGDFERDALCYKGALDLDGAWGSNGLSDFFKSFYHLNYCPTQFLGESVRGKWDIPAVLKIKGIEL
jgi:hypothetical protein